jgi:DNA gyrase subunit B
MFVSLPTKLMDCKSPQDGTDRELMIVEGDSASNSVGAARDIRFQAVLPLQGKPLNAWRASKAAVQRNEFCMAIVQAIGAGWGDSFKLDDIRYQRVIMIFDPDADGIHCGALVLMFFYRWMKPLLEDGRVFLVRPPMFEISAQRLNPSICVMTEEQAISECKRLESENYQNVVRKRFRGLAGMGSTILGKYCVSPGTRRLIRLRAQDAIAAINTFSPNHKHN